MGLVIISTINRTLLSYGVAIVGAEYISGVIPRGTHQWHRFITPRELDDGLRAAGLACGRHGAGWCFIRCGGDLNRISLVWKSITLWRQQKPADDSAPARPPKPLIDGLVIISTINRTLLSYGVAIVGAEYISGVIPRGTHQWHRFITPRELDDGLCAAGLVRTARCGMVLFLVALINGIGSSPRRNWMMVCVRLVSCGRRGAGWCYSSWHSSMASVHHPAGIG